MAYSHLNWAEVIINIDKETDSDLYSIFKKNRIDGKTMLSIEEDVIPYLFPTSGLQKKFNILRRTLRDKFGASLSSGADEAESMRSVRRGTRDVAVASKKTATPPAKKHKTNNVVILEERDAGNEEPIYLHDNSDPASDFHFDELDASLTTTCEKPPWPATFTFPSEFLTTELGRKLASSIEIPSEAEKKLVVNAVYEKMLTYDIDNEYPSAKQYDHAALSVIHKYPHLASDENSGYKEYHDKLKLKFHNRRRLNNKPSEKRTLAQQKYTPKSITNKQQQKQQQPLANVSSTSSSPTVTTTTSATNEHLQNLGLQTNDANNLSHLSSTHLDNAFSLIQFTN